MYGGAKRVDNLESSQVTLGASRRAMANRG
jgi:hypothetical protein